MERRDIFERLKMNEFYQGDAFALTPIEQDISTDEMRRQLLDKVCYIENLNQPGTEWNPLTCNQGIDLLTKALKYDLAHPTVTNAPDDNVLFFKAEILKDATGQSTYCYTNWISTSWESELGRTWIPLTEHTFDMAIIFLHVDRLTFVYFTSEP